MKKIKEITNVIKFSVYPLSFLLVLLSELSMNEAAIPALLINTFSCRFELFTVDFSQRKK